jgi:hypothetical protein
MNNAINMIDPDGREPFDIIVTAKDGTKLFTLDDGKKEITTLTATQLYSRAIQWFEPLADNYMPLKTVSKGCSSDKLKHFSSADILKFSNVDRWMLSYNQGNDGDWKSAEEGADGFLLVTIDKMPYWADAIGQIPFAVDLVTDYIKEGDSNYKSIRRTIEKGKEYGNGEIIGTEADNSNRYDNYFILRGAANGANGRNITKPITREEAEAYGL